MNQSIILLGGILFKLLGCLAETLDGIGMRLEVLSICLYGLTKPFQGLLCTLHLLCHHLAGALAFLNYRGEYSPLPFMPASAKLLRIEVEGKKA